MKKNLMMGLALIAALGLASCKSSESSYKKAYEKAKAQEVVETEQVESAPVAVTPVVTATQKEDNSGLKQERLNVMNGGNLKAFNVVCGSFSKIDNANNLRNTLVAKGYSAQVAQNPETGMYRVVASSFDDRASAVSSRDQLRGTYPDAWILYRTY